MATVRTFDQLDHEAVKALGELFNAVPTVEPYTPDGTEVYRLELTGAADGVRLILWPQLRRVDVTSAGSHAWVLRNVGQVDLIEGVEAVFRPSEGRGFLFVAVNGWVNMVMG